MKHQYELKGSDTDKYIKDIAVNMKVIQNLTKDRDEYKMSYEALKLDKDKLEQDFDDLKLDYEKSKDSELKVEIQLKKLKEQLSNSEQDCETQKNEVEFFKNIVNTQLKQHEEDFENEKIEDKNKIKALETENSELKAKLTSYESKIDKLVKDNEFLQKLLKDKNELGELKRRYSHVSSILQTVKGSQADKDLVNYADNLVRQGQTMFGKDEEMELLNEEDLNQLEARLTGKYDFNDTFKISRTNTMVETNNHDLSEDGDFNIPKPQPSPEDPKRLKSKKIQNLESKISELEENLTKQIEETNDLKEQIEFRNRYITQLETQSKCCF